MNIDHIAEFAVLARVGNYLEASELLFISQSSLSKHIQSMERELGVKLFDRTTRHISLTDEGRLFLPYARKIAGLRHEYTTALMQVTTSGTLAIGSLPIMAPYGITDAIAGFQRNNPGISVRLVEGDGDQLKQMLISDEIELAFIRDEGDIDERFRRIPFTGDRLMAILPPDHPLAGHDTITLKELEPENFLLLPEGSAVHRLVLQKCKEQGFAPTVTYTGQRAENIIDLVSKGMGVSLLMEKPARSLSHGNVAIIEVQPIVKQAIRIFTKRERDLSRMATHFINYIPYQDFFHVY